MVSAAVNLHVGHEVCQWAR